MHIWDMRLGKPEGVLTTEEQKKYDDANNLFVGCIISNLSNGLVRVYIDETEAKTLCDALVASMMQHMRAMNCTSWRVSMTTGW